MHTRAAMCVCLPFCSSQRNNTTGDDGPAVEGEGEEGEDGDASPAATGEEAGAEPGAAAAKKKKKKKKKKAGGGGGGVPTCPGGTGSKVAPARGVTGFTDSYVRCGTGMGADGPTYFGRKSGTQSLDLPPHEAGGTLWWTDGCLAMVFGHVYSTTTYNNHL